MVAPNAPAGDIAASCASVDRNPCPLPAPNPSDAVNRVSLSMRARFAANTTSYPPSASKHAAPVRNAVHVSSDVGAFDGDVNELANPTPSVAHVVNAKAMAQHESRRERRASGAYTASKLIANARDTTNESLCGVFARDDHPSAARARRAVAMRDAPVVIFGVHKTMKSVTVFTICLESPFARVIIGRFRVFELFFVWGASLGCPARRAPSLSSAPARARVARIQSPLERCACERRANASSRRDTRARTSDIHRDICLGFFGEVR